MPSSLHVLISYVRSTPWRIREGPGPSVPYDRHRGAKFMNTETVIVSAQDFLRHYPPFEPS
jgi:hypothetical protein